MIWAKLLPYAGWPLAAMMFWFWLEGRENLAKEVERCNTDKIATVAEAEAAARRAIQASYAQRLRDLELEAQNEREARALAEMARLEAESKPPITRTIVREIANADPESCLNAAVPAAIIDSVR